VADGLDVTPLVGFVAEDGAAAVVGAAGNAPRRAAAQPRRGPAAPQPSRAAAQPQPPSRQTARPPSRRRADLHTDRRHWVRKCAHHHGCNVGAPRAHIGCAETCGPGAEGAQRLNLDGLHFRGLLDVAHGGF